MGIKFSARIELEQHMAHTNFSLKMICQHGISISHIKSPTYAMVASELPNLHMRHYKTTRCKCHNWMIPDNGIFETKSSLVNIPVKYNAGDRE